MFWIRAAHWRRGSEGDEMPTPSIMERRDGQERLHSLPDAEGHLREAN